MEAASQAAGASYGYPYIIVFVLRDQYICELGAGLLAEIMSHAGPGSTYLR